ncbi:cyanophycinase [Chitinimonas sp. BJYL2]|uniref:cyanophycinase n=1 Tax=Chitinimonas sp. BJYL2 TaxID=2976696 RepID=UPI0022B32561|nr:cyanophycinase [Chitinimonas sp. BJYL2]
MKHSHIKLLAASLSIALCAPVIAGKNLVLIGGGNSACASDGSSSCTSTVTWSANARKEDLFKLTDTQYNALRARTDLFTSAQITKFASLTRNTQYNFTDFDDMLYSKLGATVYDSLSNDQYYAVLNYSEVAQLANGNTIEVNYSATNAHNVAYTNRFIQLAESNVGTGNAVIGVVTASTADGYFSYKFNEKFYKAAGAKEVVWIPVDTAWRKALGNCGTLQAKVETEYGNFDVARRYTDLFNKQMAACQSPATTVQADLNRITGIHFVGGNQAKHKEAFINANGTDTAEMAILRTRVNNGSVVYSGTSAGTAVAANVPMITGGDSYNALVYGTVAAPGTGLRAFDLTVDNGGGLKLFNYGAIDTHFGQRGRQGRIVRQALDAGQNFAYGVDENTALVVTNADTSSALMTAIGEGGVYLFDLRNKIVSTDSTTGRKKILDVLASYLTKGDTYAPYTEVFTKASNKTLLNGVEYYSSAMSATKDIFSSPNNTAPYAVAYTKRAQDFCNSRVTTVNDTTWESKARATTAMPYPVQYQIYFDKITATKCYNVSGAGRNADAASYFKMSVDFIPRNQ